MLISRVARAFALGCALLAVPTAVQAESLRAALERAYVNNPNIMSALLAVKSTAEGIALTKAGKLPTITLGADVGAGFSVTDGSAFSSYSYGLDVTYSQTLFDNNRTDAEIEQARALTEVSRYALRNAEQNVLLSVVQAYMNVIRDTQLVTLRAENLKFFEAQVESADSRLQLGEGTRIEVSQAKTRLAAATASYRAAVLSLQTSQASYERWVGRKPQNLVEAFDFGGLIPTSVDSALSSAEQLHPAILTARAAIRAAMAGSDAAKAAFGPTLSMIGNLCALGCFGDPTQGGVTGSVGFSLNVPIYTGGASGASIRRANLDQIRSEVDALAARDQVREAVITSWSALQNAKAQIESATASVESSELVVEGLLQEREVGERTTLDVLDAQAELTAAREGLIVAKSSRIIAAFALIAAAGRLSPGDLGLNVEVETGEGYIAQVEDVWQELRAIAD